MMKLQLLPVFNKGKPTKIGGKITELRNIRKTNFYIVNKGIVVLKKLKPYLDYADIIHDKPSNINLCKKIEIIKYNAALATTGAIRKFLHICCGTEYFENSAFPYTIKESNNLNLEIGKSVLYHVLKTLSLKFNVSVSLGIKFTRLRLGLSKILESKNSTTTFRTLQIH